MGMTDFEIRDKYAPVIAGVLNSAKKGSKIAWLGQKHPKYNKDLAIYNPVMDLVDREDLVHHFYDIENNNSEGCFNWDVHDRWQLSGYNIILGIRVLYLCEKRSTLIANLQETTLNNDQVIFDFMSGNPREEGDTIYLEKKNKSKSILPMLNQFYPEDKKYMPSITHHDQTIWFGDFTKAKMKLENMLTFKDSVKGRFYSLCEIKEN